MFEDHNVFEMSKKYEVLDTFTGDKDLVTCLQRFTNAEGMIFFLDSTGYVYCNDPFGEKKLKQLRDLLKA